MTSSLRISIQNNINKLDTILYKSQIKFQWKKRKIYADVEILEFLTVVITKNNKLRNVSDNKYAKQIFNIINIIHVPFIRMKYKIWFKSNI